MPAKPKARPIAGPANVAMNGADSITPAAGAMCVMPWNVIAVSPRTPRFSCVAPESCGSSITHPFRRSRPDGDLGDADSRERPSGSQASEWTLEELSAEAVVDREEPLDVVLDVEAVRVDSDRSDQRADVDGFSAAHLKHLIGAVATDR